MVGGPLLSFGDQQRRQSWSRALFDNWLQSVFLEMVHEDDFYLPKSRRGRGGRRQPIWRAASVEEFDSGSLPRLVISSRRRLRSESARRPGWREQAQMKKRWGGAFF